MSGDETRIVMASVGGPHGVRGAVKLTVFAEDPMGLRRYNPFAASDGRSLKLISVKPIGKSIVATIDGIADRDAAEALRGLTLSVPRNRLPRPDEDEFYHVDLIGLAAVLTDGTPVGTVAGVFDFGAGDVLELRGDKTVLVPFTRDVVPVVDVAAGRVVIDPIPGLFDDAAPDEGADGAPDGAPDEVPDGAPDEVPDEIPTLSADPDGTRPKDGPDPLPSEDGEPTP